MPEVSVVLPAYNAQTTIAAAVDSILQQSFENLELIVVDDGSSDGTAAAATCADPRVRIERRPHRGVAAAMNEGVHLATSPWIARMDADDWAHPTKLAKQIELLQDQSADIVGCAVNIVDEWGERVTSLARYEQWINEETLDHESIVALRFVEYPLVHPTVVARRSLFELGFRDGPFPEDYDWMLRVSAQGARFGKVTQPLFDWIDRPDRLTRSDTRYREAGFLRCRREHLRSGPLSQCQVVDIWGAGQTGKPWMQWLQSEGVRVRRAYDLDDRKVGRQIHGVPVRHPNDLDRADGTPVIVAVGAAGARGQIAPQLTRAGYQIGQDAWFVA